MSQIQKLQGLIQKRMVLPAIALALLILVAWISTLNWTLRKELQPLRLEVGRSQSAAKIIDDLQSRPQRKWTNEALAEALNSLAKQQNFPVRNDISSKGVISTAKAVRSESLIQWLADSQRESQLAPVAASFAVVAGEGPTLLDARVEWQLAGGTIR